MTEDELFDLLTAIEEKPARFEREANDLEPGEHGRASLLITAAREWTGSPHVRGRQSQRSTRWWATQRRADRASATRSASSGS